MKRVLPILLLMGACFSICNAQTINLDNYKGIWKSDLTEMNVQKPYWVLKLKSDAAVNEYNITIDKNSFYYDRNFYEQTAKIYVKNDSIQFSFIEVDKNSGSNISTLLDTWVKEYHSSGSTAPLGDYILERLNTQQLSIHNVKVHSFVLTPDNKKFDGTYTTSDIMLDGNKYVLNKEDKYSGLFEKGGFYMGDILSTFGIIFGARSSDFTSINNYVGVDNPVFGFSIFGEYTRAIKDIENDVCNIRFRFIGQPSLRYYAYTSDNIYSGYSDVIPTGGHYFGLGLQAGAGVVFYKKKIALSIDVLPVGFTLHSLKINEDYQGEATGFKSKIPLGYLGSIGTALYFRTKSSWIGVTVDYELNAFKIKPYGILEEVRDIESSYSAKYAGLAFGLTWRRHF